LTPTCPEAGGESRKRAIMGENELVSIICSFKGTDQFPIQKCAIFCKFQKIGGIAEKGHF
jgi:hypothetical protein